MTRNPNLILLNEPHSIAAESYKTFRTNLDFANIDKVNKVIMVTSSATGEGKTTTIANTAISFALAGKKVLLIDCDLRKPRVHKTFEIPQLYGLTNFLVDRMELDEVIQKVEEFDNMHIITSGTKPPNPAEIIGTHSFESLIQKVRERYDIILIDTPPVLSVTDAAVISKEVDGVVLVVAANQSRKDEVRRAKIALERVGAKILGALICRADLKKRGYYYYYYYGDKK